MSKEYKFEGKSVQSAIESGLTQLGLRRDQVEVAVITEGSSGFLGLGAKPAVIKITERLWNTGETTREPVPARQPRDKRGNQSDRNKNKAANNVQKAASSNNSKPTENKPAKHAENRNNRSADNKNGKPEQIKRRSAQVRAVQVPLKARTENTGICACQNPAEQEAPAAPVLPEQETVTPAACASAENTQPVTIAPDMQETAATETTVQEPVVSIEGVPETGLEAVQPEHLTAPALEEGVCSDKEETDPAAPAEPQAEKIHLPAKHEAAAKLACEITGELLCKMGIKATGFETGWDAIQERVLISFDTDSSAIVIGKDGQTLTSLQYVVTLIVTRKTGDTVNISLDTGSYWKKQDDKIASEVKRGINVVRSRGGVYRLPAMDSAHRRFVHKMLENNPDVETYSEGEDRWRKVVLRPRKK